jgi:predicted dehydrogenase
MPHLHRRQFIKKTLAAAATITIAGTKSTGRVLGANENIRIGVAGLHGRGSAHVGAFAGMQGVEITYLIDPDQRTYSARTTQLQRAGVTAMPRTVQDVRRALDDRNLDAISIATPNHWHSLMTIWAAQAGKHVYVEKPCSHNVKEGRIAVEMARRHNVIVQHGTQSRSSSWADTVELIRSGRFGRLQVARALCYKPRGSIGTRPNGDAPTEVDFNLWLGPAQQRPFHANLVHYNWHWFWDFGNGDIGNQGVHQMDIARWGIAGATLPRSVISVGGRFGYTDQGETPNTQIAIFDYGPTQLIFEVRGLRTSVFRGLTDREGPGNVFHCEEGTIAGSRFYPRGSNQAQPLPRLERERAQRPGGGNHFANFVAAVRSRRREDLNADILEGHYSSALCHLANISYRLGEDAPFNPRTRAFGDNREAYETLERMEEHLTQGNGLRLDGLNYRVGRKLDIDVPAERFLGNEEANRLLTRQYRAPFVVPERV